VRVFTFVSNTTDEKGHFKPSDIDLIASQLPVHFWPSNLRRDIIAAAGSFQA
jgi:hypothetical protein